MKTKIINVVVLIFVILATKSIAQPDWNTQGNATTNPLTDFVGTTDNQPLQFGTNNTFPQMTLDVTGFVGIALTPGWQLDVADAINITPVNIPAPSIN